MSTETFLQAGLRTIKMELEAIAELESRIDEDFARACEILLACKGRVVVTGMGKSGHIGNKIAATLASTGTPAFFVHPGEASHGDLGMITAGDCVIALSNSGNTAELLTLIPLLKLLHVPIISMTGKPSSSLAEAAEVNINVAVSTEACPLNLAPTSSTTAALVMGDALAIALLEARGFTAEDFAFSHPGGTLGRRLLLSVDAIMRSGEAIPMVNVDTSIRDALLEMSGKGLGMTTIVDSEGIFKGIFTDGDLRRTIDQARDFKSTPIAEVMTETAKTIEARLLAAEALSIMEDKKITSLVVVDEQSKPAGVVHMHDLLQAGIV